MFNLDWLRSVFLGEPPPSARFDLQVLPTSNASELLSRFGRAEFPAPVQRRGLNLRPRESIPEEFLARQTPEGRTRLLEVIDYRDRLQEVLDSDWSELSPEQMYVRALEGYRWLNLLENAMAKGPQQFTLHLDNVTEVLEYAIHQAQPRRRAA